MPDPICLVANAWSTSCSGRTSRRSRGSSAQSLNTQVRRPHQLPEEHGHMQLAMPYPVLLVTPFFSFLLVAISRSIRRYAGLTPFPFFPFSSFLPELTMPIPCILAHIRYRRSPLETAWNSSNIAAASVDRTDSGNSNDISGVLSQGGRASWSSRTVRTCD